MVPSPDETADQVAKAKAALEHAESEHAAAIATAEDNRTPLELVWALLAAIVLRTGNRPEQRALLHRLSTAIEKDSDARATADSEAAEQKFRTALDENPAPTAQASVAGESKP